MKKRHIGKRIEQLRTRMGLSTQDLAKRIGKSQATISRIENGKQNVNLEILGDIAKTLRVHPFALLTDAPLRHSVLLPPSTVRSEGPMRILARTLQAARQRARLDKETAAGHLGIAPDELEAIEAGYALPEPPTLRLMGQLYTVDEKVLVEYAALEEHYPRVSERMAVMQHYMGSVLNVLRDQQPLMDRAPELKRLKDEIEGCFEGATAAAERKASYFSIGHLSDRLLRALQEPDFHERAERMAADYERKRKREKAPPPPPPPPPPETPDAPKESSPAARKRKPADGE